MTRPLKMQILDAFVGAYVIAEGGEDYDECATHMESLIDAELADNAQEAFEIVHDHMANMRVKFNSDAFTTEMHIAWARKHGLAMVDEERIMQRKRDQADVEHMESVAPLFRIGDEHYTIRGLTEHQSIWLGQQMMNDQYEPDGDFTPVYGEDNNPCGLFIDNASAMMMVLQLMLEHPERRERGERRVGDRRECGEPVCQGCERPGSRCECVNARV